MTKLQIIISDEVGEYIRELAKKDGRSISCYVRKILLDKLSGEQDGATN